MTTVGTMMTAGPVANMIVPSSSPIPPVTLGAMSASLATDVQAALVSFAAIMLVVRLVVGSRTKLRRFVGSARTWFRRTPPLRTQIRA